MYLEQIRLGFSKVALKLRWTPPGKKHPVDKKPPGAELLQLSSVRLNPLGVGIGVRNHILHKIGINS